MTTLLRGRNRRRQVILLPLAKAILITLEAATIGKQICQYRQRLA